MKQINKIEVKKVDSNIAQNFRSSQIKIVDNEKVVSKEERQASKSKCNVINDQY